MNWRSVEHLTDDDKGKLILLKAWNEALGLWSFLVCSVIGDMVVSDNGRYVVNYRDKSANDLYYIRIDEIKD